MHYFPPVEIINFWNAHLLWKRSIQSDVELEGGAAAVVVGNQNN